MTAQIDDLFRYKRNDYSVSGISDEPLFEPVLLDLNPKGSCTACWRGFQACFALSGSRLILDRLGVNLYKSGDGYIRDPGPTINGIKPTCKSGEYDWFNNHYKKLNYHLEYTGGLLITDGFIQELYVHMGFHPAWKYKKVVELIFEGGILQSETDRSVKMAELRDEIKSRLSERSSDKMPTKEEIRQFVADAFDRKYWM